MAVATGGAKISTGPGLGGQVRRATGLGAFAFVRVGATGFDRKNASVRLRQRRYISITNPKTVERNEHERPQ
jgi:hypothetical protein